MNAAGTDTGFDLGAHMAAIGTAMGTLTVLADYLDADTFVQVDLHTADRGVALDLHGTTRTKIAAFAERYGLELRNTPSGGLGAPYSVFSFGGVELCAYYRNELHAA